MERLYKNVEWETDNIPHNDEVAKIGTFLPLDVASSNQCF